MESNLCNKLYFYRAKVVSVYDGDTIRADIDLGLFTSCMKTKLRLADIDTPELRGEESEDGLIVRDYVRNLVLHRDIIVKTKKTGKYGRWIAWIYIVDNPHFEDTTSISEHLLKIGYAVPYGFPWEGLPEQ